MKLRIWYGLYRLFGCPRLLVRYGKNGWITLDERDFVQRKVLTQGYYEPEVWDMLSLYMSNSEVFWDVGAHVGSVAIRALQDERIKEVHAFEPDPEQVAHLCLNTSLNKGISYIHKIALSDKNEISKFYHGPEANVGVSSLKSSMYLDHLPINVICKTADHIVFVEGVHPPSIMKIDVEGWELQVFKGAERLLCENSPKAIVFESECDNLGHLKCPEIPEFLAKFGYIIKRVKRPNGDIEPRENYIAIKQ